MKRVLFSFLLGAAAGVCGHWYFQQDAHRAQWTEAQAQVVSGAGRMATNLKGQLEVFGENSAEAIKEELARTGTVVREKAKAAGQSIAGTASNAKTTAAVKGRLVAEPGLPSLRINVDTTDGLVTLSGKVDSHEQISRAVKVSLETEGVQKVISTLQVEGKK